LLLELVFFDLSRAKGSRFELAAQPGGKELDLILTDQAANAATSASTILRLLEAGCFTLVRANWVPTAIVGPPAATCSFPRASSAIGSAAHNRGLRFASLVLNLALRLLGQAFGLNLLVADNLLEAPPTEPRRTLSDPIGQLVSPARFEPRA
jgi:hypothetical protein